MDWQLWLVMGIVAAAGVYLARQTWRLWTARKGGCGGCGCAKSPPSNAPTLIEQLTLRRK